MPKGSILKVELLASAALATIVSTPAFAQATNDDIVVTARRVEERLQDVPISITVLSSQQIANRNIVNAGDIGTYVPSLTSNSRFGPENTSFAIRGFTQEAQTAPSVAVYFADVSALRSQGGTQSGNGAGPGSLFDLQNIQVLKGPQGTLFGRNTTGGAILLVPQKPTSELEGYVEGSVGNYALRRLQAVINVPLADTARLRLGMDRQTRDGFLENTSGIGPKDFNNVDYIALRASLVLDLTPDLENYTIASYSKSDTNGYIPKIATCNTAPTGFSTGILAPRACAQLDRTPGFYQIENGNPLAMQKIEQWQAINTTTWLASDTFTVKNIASYGEFRTRNNTNLFGDNFTFAGAPFTYVGVYADKDSYNAAQYTFSEEVQLQGRSANDALIWQAGFFYENSDTLGIQSTLSPILLACTDIYAFQCSDPVGASIGRATGNIQNSQSAYEFESLGLYAQATYKLTDQFSVTGGIRYSKDRVEGLGQVRRILFPTPNVPVFVCANNPTISAVDASACAVTTVQKSSKPTWLIDIDYKPVDDVLLYAKYARGYRQGGVNASNVGLGSTWQPEKVDTYELGAKASFSGAVRGYFNIAAFYNDFSNQILQANGVPTPGNSPATALINAGKSRIRGVEVEASLTPVQGLTFDVGYAYLDTKLQSFNPPAFDPTRFTALIPTATVGGPLTLSPKNRVTVTGTYTLPIDSSIGKISFGATFTHTDSQIAAAPAATPIGVLPATDLLNLNLNWNSVAGGPLDFALFATNVTNEKYLAIVGGSYNSAGFESVGPGQPRMYGGRVRVRF